MKRIILKIILVPGIPIGIYYLFYGIALLAKATGFDAKSPHIVLEGLCLFIAICFICLVVGLILWGLWSIAEKILEFIETELYIFRRKRRHYQRELNPEESYLERIGVRRE